VSRHGHRTDHAGGVHEGSEARGDPPDLDGGSTEDSALRELATRQIERVHSFKLHLIAFVGGIVALGVIWMLTEYFQDNRWPSRFADADDGNPATWNPWFFYAVGIWAIVLGVHAVKTYARRPPTEAEIQREIERIGSRR
jgi:2TM domain